MITFIMLTKLATGVSHMASNLDLHARVHRGAYRAKPSRRVYIPKADGRQRPLGIAAMEDKILQRAVVGVLRLPSFAFVVADELHPELLITAHVNG